MSTNEATTERTPRKSPRVARLEEFLAEKSATCSLRSWNDMTEAVNVPAEMFPALMTGRPELLRQVKARPLSEDECKAVFDLLATLMKTNMALREHAELVAQSVDTWAGAFKQLERVGHTIQNFANFRGVAGDEPL